MYYEFIFRLKSNDAVVSRIVMRQTNKSYEEMYLDAWNMIENKDLVYLDDVIQYNKPKLSYAQDDYINMVSDEK